MGRIFLHLPFKRREELIQLLNEVIKVNQHICKEQLDEFNKNQDIPKENLSDYIIIGDLNGKSCYPVIKDSNLPKWLTEFLFDCYALAQNHLASQPL